MRPILALVALAALALFPSATPARQTNPERTYFAQGEKYPPGLRDFQAFGLVRTAGKRGAARYSGWVMGDRGDPDGTTVEMKTVRFEGRRLVFATNARNDIVFAFDGRFLRHQSDDFETIVGTVRKLRGGKKVAEGRMRFVRGNGG